MSSRNINQLLCHCGRYKDKRHCPNCGSTQGYALKQQITILSKQTKQLITSNVYRCRNCNIPYDDNWLFDCHATPITRKQPKQLVLDADRETIRSQYFDAAKAGKQFNHNDKLRFKKITGIEYDLFMQLLHKSESDREEERQRISKLTPEEYAAEQKAYDDKIAKHMLEIEAELKQDSDSLDDYLAEGGDK